MKFITILFLIVQIIFSLSEPIDHGSDVGTVEIRKGRPVVQNPGEFPYLVHLDIETAKMDGKNVVDFHGFCGGTLIFRKVVLTAAHCLGIKRKPKITAWLGIVDTALEEGDGQEIPVMGVTKHDGYIPSAMMLRSLNDIAILWLLYPANVDGHFVKVAKLPPLNFDAVNKLGWIVGWGRQSCGRQTTMLQKALVRGVAAHVCQKYLEHTIMPPTFICVMADNRKATSTHGDSGGPFIIDDMVVGITSFGAIDTKNSDFKNGKIICDAKKPAAYTYVPKYLLWIRDTLKEGPETVLIKPRTPSPTRRIPPPPPPRTSSLGKAKL